MLFLVETVQLPFATVMGRCTMLHFHPLFPLQNRIVFVVLGAVFPIVLRYEKKLQSSNLFFLG